MIRISDIATYFMYFYDEDKQVSIESEEVTFLHCEFYCPITVLEKTKNVVFKKCKFYDSVCIEEGAEEVTFDRCSFAFSEIQHQISVYNVHKVEFDGCLFRKMVQKIDIKRAFIFDTGSDVHFSKCHFRDFNTPLFTLLQGANVSVFTCVFSLCKCIIHCDHIEWDSGIQFLKCFFLDSAFICVFPYAEDCCVFLKGTGTRNTSNMVYSRASYDERE